MKFLALDVLEFARFHHPFSLSLDRQGLVLVEGRNYDNGDAFDSNGAGKSMLFEAIKWCLFGKMSRYGDERLGADEVTYGGRGAAVSVPFQTARGFFRVHRVRGPRGAPSVEIETCDDGYSWQPLPGAGVHAAEGTESIVNLLGFDYQTLRYALTLEGTSLDITSSGFGAQMKILESILRFDVYTEASKGIREYASGIGRQIDSVLNDMSRQESIGQQARGMIQELETLDESAREQELEREITTAQTAAAKLERLKKSRTRLFALYETARERLSYTENERDHAQEHAQSVAMLIRENETTVNCPTCERSITPASAARVLKSAQDKLAVLEIEHAQAQSQRDEARKKLDSLDVEIEGEKSLASYLKNAERELKDLRDRASKRLTMISTQRQRAETAENAVAEMTEQIAATRREHQHADMWARRGYQDLKQRTLSAATPVLNEAAARYSQILSDGAINVVFDTFRESRGDDLIRASGETAPSYDGMSNGEKRRTQIIVALALRDLARWRIGEPINFAVWDEVFDPLDESGISRAMQILQQDMDELSTVFVITHNPELKARFPGAKTLRVEREGGLSRIVV